MNIFEILQKANAAATNAETERTGRTCYPCQDHVAIIREDASAKCIYIEFGGQTIVIHPNGGADILN